jgi:hypothetical protein
MGVLLLRLAVARLEARERVAALVDLFTRLAYFHLGGILAASRGPKTLYMALRLRGSMEALLA